MRTAIAARVPCKGGTRRRVARSTRAAITFATLVLLMPCTLAAGPVDDAVAGYRAGVEGEYALSAALLTFAIESGRLPPRALLVAYINRGASYTKLARFEEAIGDYDRVLATEPDNALVIANKALALAKWDRYDEALPLFARALGLDPHNAKTLLERGNAYFDKGSYRDAITDYEAALRLSPDLQQARDNRREAARRMAHPDLPCTCEPPPHVRNQSETADKSARTSTASKD